MGKGTKVFISSTFRDLDKERDYIVKSIFPRIINELNGKLVQEVDLRWGITEEQASSGLVVDLCLRYLINSKPFIIGILGERYGSSFTKGNIQLSPIVKSAFPHIEQQLQSGKSITEIEIINGALESTDQDIKAIFFIKETSAPAPGETMEQYQKLCALKKKVREQDRFPVHTYNSLLDFDHIIKFITQNIRADHKKTNITDLDKATYYTQIKLNQYRDSTIYDSSVLNGIYRHIELGNPISIVSGKAGIGKSTLMAHLGLNKEYKYRKFIHFYGDSLILPLSDEMFQKYFFEFASHILKKEDERVATYEQFLVSAISRTKWCFVIDNISHGATELLYLPKVIERCSQWMEEQFGTKLNYKILIVKNIDTTIPKSVAIGAETYILSPGNYFNPKEFVESYMAEFSKCLSQQQINTLVSSPAAKTPMSLELICHFLRENVSFDRLNEFIGLFSIADSWQDVIDLYIKHLFKNCDKKDIKEIVTVLCTYSAPMSRKELLDCSKVQPLSFNIILSYMDKMMDTDNDGRIRLVNDTVRQALVNQLNITQEDIKRCAQASFGYFHDRSHDLHTQEDFILESDKKFWIFYKYWEDIIPSCYYWRYPRLAQDNIMGKGSGVHSLLRLCGGRSYENSHLPYLSYISGITFSYAERIQLFERKKRKGEITEEEAKKHEEWVDETGKKLKNLRNPYIYDVIHSLESLMWTGSYESAKRILSNPPYGNRIIETRYFSNFWRCLHENGFDLKDERIRKNTLFPASGYYTMCMLLDQPEAAEFYRRSKWKFKFSEEWTEKHFRGVRYSGGKRIEYKNARYDGEVDFFNRPHKSGYIEYIQEDNSLDIYFGGFKHNKMHGKGTYIYASGHIYEGEWKKGVKHGKGTLAYPNGAMYEGDFVNGSMSGHCKYHLHNGDIYEGEIRDGKFEGKGKYTWTSGAWCMGTWHNGEVDERAKDYQLVL